MDIFDDLSALQELPDKKLSADHAVIVNFLYTKTNWMN
jgi:hypothetical protein